MAKSKTLPILLGVVALVIIVGVGLFLFLGKGSGFSGLERFPSSAYLEGPEDFLGNRYLLEAQIVSQIVWDEQVGRILAVSATHDSVNVPIFIPASITENLHVGQRYRMRVNVVSGGLIQVEELRKF